MKTIITPEEVVELAFTAGEYLNPQAISPHDIAAATAHYLEPVIGEAMCRRLIEGEYSTLREEYVKGLLSLAVRLEIQPTLDMRTGGCGSVVSATSTAKSADMATRSQHRRALRRRVSALARQLSHHLNNEQANYPEYRPERNILNRCTTDGGIIQTF